ncbi:MULTISPECIES: hypothetical protein [Neobacillus]|uniref:Transposase n=1 Tax=Neobacillus rhizophilus TaxID=2833579 RepID=A0A942U3T1_9BACI|nr:MULTISPECIES: hypothetical protein [Neobacillus]MBS4214135.1 hypothetical protein [Neobacillus rhizophilus]
MKFKMQNKQNQLIERIYVKHLVVSVDIAQQFHVARAVTVGTRQALDAYKFHQSLSTNLGIIIC